MKFQGQDLTTLSSGKSLYTVHVNAIVWLTAGMSRGPTLSRVMSGGEGGGVVAVTSLGDDVFVLRHNSRRRVEVYDAVSCTFQRHITVHGPDRPFGFAYNGCGLAVCARYKCLYVSADDWDTCIYRAELTGSNAVMKWSVASSPAGLSVNRAHNVVVACWCENKLQEYTTHGSLVREICLQAGVTWPFHAVQLSIGDYVVSQWTSPGVVSVVGVDGQVRHSYGQSQTSDVGQMKYARGLAVTKNDDIIVADMNNNRILSMNSSLSCVQELALPVDGGIKQPRGLCLDESRGRLSACLSHCVSVSVQSTDILLSF